MLYLTEMLNEKEGRLNRLSMQETMRALSDPTRRDILNLLKKGRMSAGEIVDSFPITGAAISRHLSVLKEAGLITDEREGKYIFYALNTSVLEEILLWLEDLKQTQGEKDGEGDAHDRNSDRKTKLASDKKP